MLCSRRSYASSPSPLSSVSVTWSFKNCEREPKLDLATVKTLVWEMPLDGMNTLWSLHERYLGTVPPLKAERASVDFRMRLVTLALLEQQSRLRLARARPELGLDGTNNASERAIGKSKIRYRTVRGYKRLEGMCNGITLTQHLYRGVAELNLAGCSPPEHRSPPGEHHRNSPTA
jgi:hypothetical protein